MLDHQSHTEDWRLLSVDIQEKRKQHHIPLFTNNNKNAGTAFSLIIGPNGVGKSFLLRAILDFYIDFDRYRTTGLVRKSVRRYTVVTLSYAMHGQTIAVEKKGLAFNAYIPETQKPIDLQDVFIPNIVAAHFGLYDRFPVKTQNYDVPFYRYVGAKAGGNFISTNNIITQMLFNLCEDKQPDAMERVTQVFEHINYQPRVSICVRMLKDEFRQAGDVRNYLMQSNRNYVTPFLETKIRQVETYTEAQWDELIKVYAYLRARLDEGSKRQVEIILDMRSPLSSGREMFRTIYLLKQLHIIGQLSYTFYRGKEAIDSNSLSSGEINMLATVISVASSMNAAGNLVLLDEPELNQHPNWQMSIITELKDALRNMDCHFLIASHSHLLVSDLPIGQSAVVRLNYAEEKMEAELLQHDTYGWSAENILLRVFHTATDRNKYFGELVGHFLDRIKNNEISKEDVQQELTFIQLAGNNLHETDPMKRIIEVIVNTFNKE